MLYRLREQEGVAMKKDGFADSGSSPPRRIRYRALPEPDKLNPHRMFTLPKDGRLTPELRWILTNGHCHSFALALHLVTGWPLVGIYDNGLRHVLCQRPDWVIVDARQAHPSTRARLLSPLERFRLWQRGDGWLKPVHRLLTPFAQDRVEELGQQDRDFHEYKYPGAV
jgi:hypothetical protein